MSSADAAACCSPTRAHRVPDAPLRPGPLSPAGDLLLRSPDHGTAASALRGGGQRLLDAALNRAQASVDGSGRARRNPGGELFDLPLQLAILFDESGDRSVQLLDQLMTAQSAAAC